jgi:hypothetical protein
MTGRNTVRLTLVSVALFALVFAAMLSAVWHSHGNSSDANCSICHLNHQQIDHPLPFDRSPNFSPIGNRTEQQEPRFAPGLAVARGPARAPPAA